MTKTKNEIVILLEKYDIIDTDDIGILSWREHEVDGKYSHGLIWVNNEGLKKLGNPEKIEIIIRAKP